MGKSTESEDEMEFTAEEKQWILEGLNKERKKRQEEEAARKKREEEEAAKLNPELMDDDTKQKIREKLNEERKFAQKYKELARRRLKDKKVYKIANKVFHKFLDMERSYYIQIDDCKRFSSHPQIFSLYYEGFDGLKEKKVMIQIKDYSEKIFISDDTVKIYFKQFSLEDNH